MRTSLLALPLLLLITAISQAQDAYCELPTPCEAFEGADAVFVGKVIKVVQPPISIWMRDKDYNQTATVAIEKTYKGRTRSRLVFHQLGSKNARKFLLGNRYLIYADFDRVRKRWEAKHCWSPRMIKYSNDDLRYLDGLPTSFKKTRIAGEVVRYKTSADNPQGDMERLSGIKLKIIGNGKEYAVVTDANGVYELYDAPAGTYIIQPDIPAGLTLFSVRHYGAFDLSKIHSLTIELKQGGCSGALILLTPISQS